LIPTDIRLQPTTTRSRASSLETEYFKLETRSMSFPVTPEKIDELARRMAALGINEQMLLEKFVRGSGAGGQKINKTNNCVFLKHLPSGVCVKCQIDRSRELNRYLARRELCEQIERIRDGLAVARTQAIEKMRRQQRPRSRRSKSRSIEDKRRLAVKKALRRRPGNE